MTLGQIIDYARSRLDDIREPYLWSQQELIAYANAAEQEACIRADLIIDDADPTLCFIPIVPGQARYTTDEKYIRAVRASRGPIVVGTGISWASNALVDASSRFLNAGFAEGDPILVSGFSTSGNNGYFTASAVTASSISVNELATNETPTTTIRVEGREYPLTLTSRKELDAYGSSWNLETGNPTALIQEVKNQILLYPVPTQASVLRLVVSRLPNADMEDEDTDSPEIPRQYHLDLVDWICHLAYLKKDAETFNQQLADLYDREYERKFGPRPSAWVQRDRKAYPYPRGARPREFGY